LLRLGICNQKEAAGFASAKQLFYPPKISALSFSAVLA
jgi:hypothetical protein